MTRPPSVDYRLTALGETLTGPIASIRSWADDHFRDVVAARTRHSTE